MKYENYSQIQLTSWLVGIYLHISDMMHKWQVTDHTIVSRTAFQWQRSFRAEVKHAMSSGLSVSLTICLRASLIICLKSLKNSRVSGLNQSDKYSIE